MAGRAQPRRRRNAAHAPEKVAVQRITQYGRPREMVVNYGFTRFKGQAPYFSITADVYRLRGARGARGRIESAGMQHDLITKHAPALRGLLRWHLVAWPGDPMHYEENAIYWAELATGRSRYKARPGDPDAVKAFKSTIVWGAVRTDKGQPWKLPIPKLRKWLRARRPNLKRSFQRAMKRHGLSP